MENKNTQPREGLQPAYTDVELAQMNQHTQPHEGLQPDIASELEALAAEALSEAPTQHTGQTPEQQAESQAQEAFESGQEEYAEAVGVVLGPAFQILAPNWRVTDAEIQQLSISYAAVLQKYYPGGMGKIGPEFTALAITAMILAPRIRQPRHEQQQPEKQQPVASESEGEVKSDDTPVSAADMVAA